MSIRKQLAILGKRTVALAVLSMLAILPARLHRQSAGQLPLAKQSLSVNGVDRTYSYYVSTKSNSFSAQWVVFVLHDNGQSAEEFAAQSGWPKVAEENGFVVVFPQALANTWTPSSGANDEYLKAVFEHARTHLISKWKGDTVPSLGSSPQADGGNLPIWAWEPLRDLVGVGAGATAAQEFAMNYPGLFAGVATMNGVAYTAAYAHADEPAQNIFEHMRGKNVEPVWKQKKGDVPEAVWMFDTGAQADTTKQAAFWKKSAAVDGTPIRRSIAGFDTTIFRNAGNPAQQLRVSTIPRQAKWDETMSRAVWNDMFAHLARWTSSPNGDLTPVRTEAEVNHDFEVRTIEVAGSEPYKYYLKLPSSYKNGQKLPLVLSTHGANEQAWLFVSKIRMEEVGEKEGFITVYPSGHQNHWASSTPDGPDSKFLEALIKDVVTTYGADPTRVYMQGFSNGSIMTQMMGVTHPELFAAVSPNNGPGPLPPPVKARVDEIKAAHDYRIPMMAVYGNVDSGASFDGLIVAGVSSAAPGGPSSAGAQGGIETMKAFNHITTPDKVESFTSIYTAPYPVDMLQGKRKSLAIDDRYPQGRFQVYEYESADPTPMNLLDVVWILDLPHAYDPREARLEWDYFRHWTRNADGSLTYSAK